MYTQKRDICYDFRREVCYATQSATKHRTITGFVTNKLSLSNKDQFIIIVVIVLL